jgi:hypothetical protein
VLNLAEASIESEGGGSQLRSLIFTKPMPPSNFVAFESHSAHAARSTTSTAAKYFGEFGAGLPSGTSSFAATSGVYVVALR